MTNAILASQALQAASVTGWFTLDELCAAISLTPDDTMRRDQVWRVLAPVATERISQGGAYCWQIAPDARRSALRDFYALPQLERFMEHAPKAYEGNATSQPDLFGLALHQLLRRQRLSFDDPGEQAKAGELREAMKHAAAILDAVQFAVTVPALDGQTYQVRRRKDGQFVAMTLPALKDFAEAKIKELQGRCDIKVVMPDKHFGYSTERRKISAFVRGKTEQTMPILLTGVGGAGKSALLSRLLTGWRRTDPDMIPVLLDFDRRQLNFGEPVEIFQEVLRQIIAVLGLRGEVSDSPLRAGLHKMRDDLALHKTSTTGTRETNQQQASDVRGVLRQLNLDWAKPLRKQKIALILDTFEAVDKMAGYFRQVAHERGEKPPENAVVSQIMDLMSYLQRDVLPGLRVVVSGREEPLTDDELDQWFGTRLRLRGLSTTQGARLLQDQATKYGRNIEKIFQNVKKAAKVSQLLDGHPLALIAFVRYVSNNPKDVDGLIGELEKEGGFQAEFAQIFLYERILDRIGDKAVQPLAHPGLMLRRIDWKVIRYVLAAPCLDRGPGSAKPMTDADAQELFERLRNQYWLVDPVADETDTVQHVPELRRKMLDGLLAGPSKDDNAKDRARKMDLKRRALDVCRAAAEYYAVSDDANHALDALYYRSFNDPVPPDLDAELAKRLARHLGEDVATMSIGWRAQIKFHLNGELTSSELEALSEEQQAKSVDQAYSKAQQVGLGTKSGKPAADLSGLKAFSASDRADDQETPAPPPVKSKRRTDQLPSIGDLFQLVEIGWHTAQPKVFDDALVFLEALCAVYGRDGTEKELEMYVNGLQKQPFTDPAYIAALISATTHTPRTQQITREFNFETLSQSRLGVLLYCAQQADAMMSWGVKGALHAYLKSFSAEHPVAANRTEAPRLLILLGGFSEEDVGVVHLDYPGMALAAGSDNDAAGARLDGAEKSARKGPFYASFISPLWEARDQERLSHSMIERVYRGASMQVMNANNVTGLSEQQRIHFHRIVRGLNPELHAPTVAILGRLPLAEGERVVVDLTRDVALWPSDLQYDDQLIYDSAEAPTIVETADRCGVLRELLVALKPFDPFAERLVAIYDFITQTHFDDAGAS